MTGEERTAGGGERGTRTASAGSIPATVDRIAAGEVVTRPARVVGELIDNALDAGASRVEVAVEGDGTDRIRVDDDGRGMSREDARLAVERHATSKLAPDGDPVGVGSLGFRGEALAAIAEAARLELVTSDGDPVGTRVVVVGGRRATSIRTVPPSPTPDAPARHHRRRRGSVRDPTRASGVAGGRRPSSRGSPRWSTDYARATPEWRSRWITTGRGRCRRPGPGSRRRCSACTTARPRAARRRSRRASRSRERGGVGGDGAASTAVEVAGALAYPSVTRSSRDHVRVSVNGGARSGTARRPRSERDTAACSPDGREPVATIDVSLQPARVDPNVHPAKRESGSATPTRSRTLSSRSVVADALTGADLRRKAEVETGLDGALEPVGGEEGERLATFADADPIGTFCDLYLLVEAGDELLVVDTPPARARELRVARPGVRWRGGADRRPRPAGGRLAVGRRRRRRPRRRTPTPLAALGFETEPFGGGDRQAPDRPAAPFGRSRSTRPRSAMRSRPSQAGASPPRDARETLLADLACHPSLKRGEIGDLDAEELRSLLDRLGECDRPYACPHGRPTVLSVDEATFAAGFGRDR